MFWIEYSSLGQSPGICWSLHSTNSQMHLRFANRRVSRCNRCWQSMGGIFPLPGLQKWFSIHDGFMHSLRYSCFSPIYAADLQIAIMGITTWHNVAQRKKNKQLQHNACNAYNAYNAWCSHESSVCAGLGERERQSHSLQLCLVFHTTGLHLSLHLPSSLEAYWILALPEHFQEKPNW